jgi:hypothetical protein
LKKRSIAEGQHEVPEERIVDHTAEPSSESEAESDVDSEAVLREEEDNYLAFVI